MLSLTGCDSAKNEPPPANTNTSSQQKPLPELKTFTLLVDAGNVTLAETATAALPAWRVYAQHKPVLVLFSNDPFLYPVPAPLHAQTMELVRNGDLKQIKVRAVDITPDPLLLHRMAVDAALKAGFFSKLVWVLPNEGDKPLLPLEAFKQKMVDSGIATSEEAKSFALQGGTYSGVLRGIPISACGINAIPQQKAPAWVHFDLSFFKPLYRNEVSTPLYPLIFGVMKQIRTAHIPCVSASVSYSNLGGAIALKVRFIGQDLAHLIKNPDALDGGLPELQIRRAQNLYLEQFMKKDDILKNCQTMNKLAPDNASVKFDLYNAYREIKKGNMALESLRQAVVIDQMYAYEYIFLAETALNKGRPDAALEMLGLARKSFPGNPTIPLLEAKTQILLGHREPALSLVKELRTMPWSKVYDQEMTQRLEQLEKAAMSLPPDQG